MPKFETIVPDSFTAKVHGVDFPVAGIHAWPEASLRKVVEYGLQRIFNDSAASGKDEAERLQLAGKRLDNLVSGVLRATGSRTGDPVKRRALELAETAVSKSPKFIAWLGEAKLKAGDKVAVAKRRELANKFVENYMAQAKIDVEAQAALPALEIDSI